MPVFPVYNKCNNHCIMCTNTDKFWQDKLDSLSNLSERIERFRSGEQEFLDNYKDVFSITGGEPTLSPHLVPLIKKINDLFTGIRLTCLTNGRMFSYRDFAKCILDLGVNLELAIAIHGHNAEVHDRITRTPGSFIQMVGGLENIFRFKKSNHLIEIRIVIHQLNYKFLKKIIKFIKANFPQIDRLVFIFFEIEGQAYKNFNTLRLTYTQLLPYISRIYNPIHYFLDVRFYHFPLCVLPVRFFPYIWRTLPQREVSFIQNCEKCYLKKFCLGIHKGYLGRVGNCEFKPITRKLNIKKSSNWHHPILRINL